MKAEPVSNPTSDISTRVSPFGANNITSMSSCQAWLIPLSVTETILMAAGPPVTLITEGLGVAAPTALIVIAAGLLYVCENAVEAKSPQQTVRIEAITESLATFGSFVLVNKQYFNVVALLESACFLELHVAG